MDTVVAVPWRVGIIEGDAVSGVPARLYIPSSKRSQVPISTAGGKKNGGWGGVGETGRLWPDLNF